MPLRDPSQGRDHDRERGDVSIRMHKREQLVQDAEIALMDAINEWYRSDAVAKLTEWELVSLLSSQLSNRLGGIAKYAIRDERHGDRNKPGGVE
jgi:hypothetical protein